MRSLWAAGAVLGAASATAAEPAGPPSLCEQPAAQVGQSPATVWESHGANRRTLRAVMPWSARWA